MNTVVVIVTYADRFHLLIQVIKSLLEQKISKIIVVDNNSVDNSKKKLKQLEFQLNDKIKVIYLAKNYGSSGGFKKGIQEAEKITKNFIWLLDDDNLPDNNALQPLLDFSLTNLFDKNNTIIVSLRKDRKNYINSVQYNDPELLIGKRNSFMQFDCVSYFKNKFSGMKKKIKKNNTRYGELLQAPYGGMFFHKNIINQIGYPDERFFVYTDDTEYSYRIIKRSGKIYLNLDSTLTDIDASWNNIKYKKKNVFSSLILDTDSEFRVYYSFRNRVYFELNNRVDNKIIYFFNLLFFMAKLGISALFTNKLKRYFLIVIAIYDGIKGNLGERI